MRSIRSSRVITPGGIRPATITFENGQIASLDDGPAELDYGDLHVFAGLVDSHVHVNEPGRTDWEGFETATRAAAAGGTTTVVDMPLNSIPPTVDVPALEIKRAAAHGQLNVDLAFWGGLIPGTQANLGPLAEAGVCGFKSFLVDSGVEEFPPIGIDELEDGLRMIKSLGVPSLLHAEDPASLVPMNGDTSTYASYLASRPIAAEEKAVAQVVDLAAASGTRIHVLHVSSPEAAWRIDDGPDNVSGETCPHYLVFCAEEIPDRATPYKCAPPIRDAAHREGLWDALGQGALSMVVSDHSPAPAEIKGLDSGDFELAWGGVGSLQLRLSATWTGAHQRGYAIESLASWLALEPARLAGLEAVKGSIEVGKDADFVVFDADGLTKVSGSHLEHRHPITPYDGMELRGRVVETILGGEVVYRDGQVQSHLGRMIRP